MIFRVLGISFASTIRDVQPGQSSRSIKESNASKNENWSLRWADNTTVHLEFRTPLGYDFHQDSHYVCLLSYLGSDVGAREILALF